MKLVHIVLLKCICLTLSMSQGNRVFSGGEVNNCGIVDISARNGIAWSTERSATPGYFSVIHSAAYIGCTDSANINGYIKKYGNSSFIFPVGSGDDIRTLEISAPTQLSDAYATAWILGDPTLPLDPTAPYAGAHPVNSVSSPIVEVSTIGQWDWQVGNAGNLGSGTTGTGNSLTITVSIPDMTSFALASYLRLVGWNGTRWIDLSGSATANGNTEDSFLRGRMRAGITAIGIGRVEPVLAIKLESFTGELSECNTILSWTTSREINSDLFIVEQSFDATHFYAITSVQGSGLQSGNAYNVTVNQPTGIAYYRLKMRETDTSFMYSTIIAVRNTCTVTEYMMVYPNPVSAFENLNLSFTTSYMGKAEFEIFNNLGQQLISREVEVAEGSNLISLDVSDLSAASYFIRVIRHDGKQIGKGYKFIRN
jgi:hypothetical protein